MKLSCVTASYVADLLGYPGAIDWGEASQRAAQAPLLSTIDGMLERLAPARLDGIELWFPHVWPGKVTPSLASVVRRRLAARGMACCACAGGLPDPAMDPDGCEELFQVTQMLHAPLIAAHLPATIVPRLGAYCERYGVRVGFENGHERDVSEIIDVIREGGPWLGANLDTGNLAAQGGDPVRAVRELAGRLVHVHFKDVPAVGAHDCVALGKGIVDVRGVVRELKALGYDGWLSIEIETADRDPTEEIIASAGLLRELW